MKRFCATFFMLAALLAVSSSAYSDQRLRFEATLSGAQEVTIPPLRWSGHGYDGGDQGEF
jgi:hypothetical protein